MLLKIKKYLKRLKIILLGAHVNQPVAQIYNLDGMESRLGINNFYSVLSSDKKIPVVADIVFYNDIGKKILKIRKEIPYSGTIFLDVSLIFKENGVWAKTGIVSVRIKPRIKLDLFFEKFGLVTSHFFMFYYTQKIGSIGQVHSLSLIPSAYPMNNFESSQRIFTQGLAEIKLFQMNPTRKKIICRFSLLFEGEEVFVVTEEFQPFTAKVVPLDFPKTLEGKILSLKVSPLPSENSKPLILRVFDSGYASISHS